MVFLNNIGSWFLKGMAFLCLAALFSGCVDPVGPELPPEPDVEPEGDEIVFSINPVDDPGSRAVSAFTSLKSKTIYWAMTTGSYGSESRKKASTSFSCPSNTETPIVSTGIYQTNSPTTYNYYVSNRTITTPSSGTGSATVSATGGTSGTDVVVGRNRTSSTNVSITLNHVFARLYSFSFTAPSGYAIGSITASVKVKDGESNLGSSGTYSLSNQSWSSTSGYTSYVTLGSSASFTADHYLIPGNYTLQLVYTLTRNGLSFPFTKTADITLSVGNKNNVSATLPNDGKALTLKLSVSGWDSTHNTSETS